MAESPLKEDFVNIEDIKHTGEIEEPRYFPIRLVSHPYWCLDAAGGSVKNGTNLILFGYHGGDNQLWTYDGTYIRSKKDPNFVIDVSGGKIARGTNIQLWEINHSDAQKWDFDGRAFRLRKNPKFVLDLNGNKKEPCRNIHLWEWNSTGAQLWTHIRTFDKVECPFYFPIRLQANPNWVVDICGGKIKNGTELILFPHHGRCNQLWLYDGTFIRSRADPNYVIDVDHCRIKSGTRLHLWRCNGTAAQQWDFDGTLFRLRANPDFVIDLKGNRIESRRPIHLWKFNGTQAQKWFHEDLEIVAPKESPVLAKLFDMLPKTQKYEEYRDTFYREEVDIEILQELLCSSNRQIFHELGVDSLLHLKKITNAIKKLLANSSTGFSGTSEGCETPPDYVNVNKA